MTWQWHRMTSRLLQFWYIKRWQWSPVCTAGLSSPFSPASLPASSSSYLLCLCSKVSPLTLPLILISLGVWENLLFPYALLTFLITIHIFSILIIAVNYQCDKANSFQEENWNTCTSKLLSSKVIIPWLRSHTRLILNQLGTLSLNQLLLPPLNCGTDGIFWILTVACYAVV